MAKNGIDFYLYGKEWDKHLLIYLYGKEKEDYVANKLLLYGEE